MGTASRNLKPPPEAGQVQPFYLLFCVDMFCMVTSEKNSGYYLLLVQTRDAQVMHVSTGYGRYTWWLFSFPWTCPSFQIRRRMWNLVFLIEKFAWVLAILVCQCSLLCLVGKKNWNSSSCRVEGNGFLLQHFLLLYCKNCSKFCLAAWKVVYFFR